MPESELRLIEQGVRHSATCRCLSERGGPNCPPSSPRNGCSEKVPSNGSAASRYHRARLCLRPNGLNSLIDDLVVRFGKLLAFGAFDGQEGTVLPGGPLFDG